MKDLRFAIETAYSETRRTGALKEIIILKFLTRFSSTCSDGKCLVSVLKVQTVLNVSKYDQCDHFLVYSCLSRWDKCDAQLPIRYLDLIITGLEPCQIILSK